MRRARTIAWALALAVSWLAVTGTSGASSDAFKVIVNRANPVRSVSSEFLRNAFLKRTLKWNHGEVIRPIDLPPSLPARDRFTREVLHKTPAALRVHWLQRIFSGTDMPPPAADSTAAAIAYVTANRGAVSYLPADVDPGGAKVIELQP
jgi:hypothetical protein